MTPTKSKTLECDLMVIGGGIAGITAAVEAAEMGRSVMLVEKEHYLGGQVARMHRYFPKLCPPLCGMEINFRRIKNNTLITALTGAAPAKIASAGSGYQVEVMVEPRFVTEACTACGDCEKVCTVEAPDAFNMGLTRAKAIRLPYEMAYPYRYYVDKSAVQHPSLQAAAKICPAQAIDLSMQPLLTTVKTKAVVWAAGWQSYDAAKLPELGFDVLLNVVTNLQFERIAANAILANNKIVRPSDGAPLASVAFVQCAGSRDDNHLPYCSAVCCMASLKQSRYIREQYPDAEIHIFFIDARTPGRWEDFYVNVQDDPKTIVHRGKVGKIEAADNSNLTIIAENTLTGNLERVTVGMAILAVGMEPVRGAKELGLPLAFDKYGFAYRNGAANVMPAGVAAGPKDVAASVQEATGSVALALSAIGRSI
ncbi:MAG: CoB--CoM heterodisulfide reductase iron-sulfur subunit A family protein [Calditrichaeota bacterium]|nr:CoB--CoM heterodisulfide reductase iron-sulfur subunit A family protein [Calditrichota bacterium]